MLKIISAGIVFIFVVGASFYSSLVYRYRPTIDEVCTIVVDNYFDLSATEKFARACEKAKHEFPQFASAHSTVQIINDLLSNIQTSHLNLFEPEESTKIWFHESIDNGIRARDISGFVVIFEVLQGSAAEKAGLKKGDEILSVDQNEIHLSLDIVGRSGDFIVVRNEHTLSVTVLAEKYEEDESLVVQRIDETHAVLRVKSFLSPFFESEKFSPIVKELRKYPNLLIDLRGNIGGSFPAMMRLMSVFICEPQFVGRLTVSPQHLVPEEDLKDDLETESQLAQIERVQILNLRTFKLKRCLNSRLSVLVDRNTSSVSEIFADGLHQLKRAQIAGQPTAGEVVMAKWFLISSLGTISDGTGYSLSVPIADYENLKLKKLEEVGIRPDIFLDYNFERALLGNDSWIDEILKLRHK